MKTTENFTAYWIGRCPVKGCGCRLHVDVPMIRERWTQTCHDHAHGTSWEEHKKREYPVQGSYWSVYSLALHCREHRRELRWKPVNGKLSTEHVCDSRCMNATGPNCECSCGGANHGRGHHVELHFT